ncbi:hypothetical protein F4809DRAFT_158751 [Biscogniauxia mediterranea]|nr:hypothetical protein F4809DRAFT_158751 [Biscogniauxia mediterranea]
MSRKLAKSRATSGRAFTNFGASSFGAFSSASTGTNLSYLAEPPDFTSISDANVVVALKNLQKKDATTKSKALEELVAYVQAHPHEKDGGTEEPVLEAWVQLYPRISIDNSRRVRELSHILQFELMKSARKRMEKRIPKIVGSWLAGTFDRDRAVSRAATEGLSSFLTTPEKVAQFWKRCQQQIIDYASDAIKETPDTLSDQRSTSADDAEAKCHRVLSGGLVLVLNLLQRLDPTEIEKCLDSYDQFFEDNKVWASVTINDVVTRRLACQLLLVCLERRPGRIEADLTRLSKVFVAEGLRSNQTGSATDFVMALTKLTEKHPTVWTTEYKGKKSPTSRLKVFLEKGSQGGSTKYWEALGQLITILPNGVLPEDLDGAMQFLQATRSGLTSRDEPRINAVDAWSTYLGVARHFIATAQSSDARLKTIRENIFPLITHYLYPTPETSMWVSGNQLPILIKAYTSTATSPFEDVVEATRAEWNRLKDEFKERIRHSLPEASKEYQKSQHSISEEGGRWFSLTGAILDAHEKTIAADRPIPDIPVQPSLELLQESLKLLQARNWKPFGAASTVEAAFKKAPMLFKSSSAEVSNIIGFLEASLSEGKEGFLQAPSATYLLSSINLLGEIPDHQEEFERVWKANVATLLELIEEAEALPALTKLISSKRATPFAQQAPILQTELIKRCLMCAVGNPASSWDLFDAVVTFSTLTEPAEKRLVKELTSRITNPHGQPDHGVLRGLRLIAQKKPELLSQDEEVHMSLMTSLLSLSERTDPDAEVMTLKSLMEGPSKGGSRLLALVQNNINGADGNSLAVATLVQQAMQVYQTLTTSQDQGAELMALLPDADIWRQELSILLEEPPDPSLALTSGLGGAYYLPQKTPTTPKRISQRDQNGCSISGRMAIYMSMLLSSGFSIEKLQDSAKIDLIINMSLTAEISADQLTAMSENSVWSSLSFGDNLADAESLTPSIRKIINAMVDDAMENSDTPENEKSRLLHKVIYRLIEEAKALNSMGLYHARVLSGLLQSLNQHHRFHSSRETLLSNLDTIKSAHERVFPGVAILSGLGESVSSSKAVNNFCNRLVSDIAGAKLGEESTLFTLVLLNECMRIYDLGELPVANNRLVFAVRQITSWLETPDDLDYRFAAEVCRSLQCLLPCIKDVYGSYWEKSLDFCFYLWTEKDLQSLDSRLPGIHASLRLVSTLESLEDPNDDLVDALQSSAEKKYTALLGLLKLPMDKETQPRAIVDALVRRRVEGIPLHHVKDLSDLYGLVASESRSIQSAAFTLISRAIPAIQEQLSVDILLAKTDARLPDELLSLLLDAPTIETYPEDVLTEFPTPIRTYLLSWLLVFDMFRASAFKVRGDYAEQLKGANYIGPLLEFTFDVLGHSVAHALNLDKAGFQSEDIRSYDLKLGDSDSNERNMQWLLIHIFYLVLKYVPGLFKSWFINCRSKQTKIAVQGWMTKYFSPIIISEALDDVAKWSSEQEPPADDEKELIVKVSRAVKEITAGYEVDELQASIAIRIPDEFPLEGVTVVGLNRVAVNERKWQSWIMITQGVITFSGGGIIDGLMAFRRNVVGALKGQTECAICYSIISTDKRTPDKRCQTCKNLFHRTCLYKWFQSSSQNTCPLCRNPIDYLSADSRSRRGGT